MEEEVMKGEVKGFTGPMSNCFLRACTVACNFECSNKICETIFGCFTAIFHLRIIQKYQKSFFSDAWNQNENIRKRAIAQRVAVGGLTIDRAIPQDTGSGMGLRDWIKMQTSCRRQLSARQSRSRQHQIIRNINSSSSSSSSGSPE